jgi:hypothetical protein
MDRRDRTAGLETTRFARLGKGWLAGAMTGTHAGHLFDPRQRRESRHPACGLIQALVLIEGAVPLSSTFDAQALDHAFCRSKRSSDRYASPGN